MKFSSRILLTLAIALSFLLLFGGVSFSQEKMTMDDYRAQLAEWQEKEAEAIKAAEECAEAVAQIKVEMQTVQAENEKIWGEILAMIGVDQAAVDEFRTMLQDLEAEVDGMMALTPEELFKKRKDLEAIEGKLAEAKKNRVAALTEMQNLIASIEGKITQLKNKMPRAMYDDYTVVVGDYLWKISGKSDIYNDPIQWMRIYSYNRDQIKNPDLIYSDQILKIHRESGPEEYLVAQGDYLKKIAANPDVIGDPTAWTKIYEKNKDIIGEDENLIFPYTVLVIPKE